MSTASSSPSADNSHHRGLVSSLIDRWPEHRVAPSLGRIQALCDLMGNPERTCPVIQVAGTNGKGSTCAMIDSLCRSAGLRTGRFSSPHLEDITERIRIDGDPISQDRFDELWQQVGPLVDIVDAQQVDGVRMTFFEVLTGLAFAAFADAPVDVMVLEVGLGGTWDSTNVAHATVAVVTPIDFDHMHILGATIEQIAANKAGIIKSGATAVLAGQRREAATVLMDRCVEVGAVPVLEGPGFCLADRQLALGGQLLRIVAAEGSIGDLHLPLHGEHMARNAALAVAAVEALLGRGMQPDVIADGLGAVRAPGRLELVRRSPAVVIDTGHNPHAVQATLAGALEAYGFEPMIGVVAMMGEKDVVGVLELLSESLDRVVVTKVSSTDRGMPVAELAERAADVFGENRVDSAPDMAAALERAIAVADAAGEGAGVLVVGSVIAAGEARTLLGNLDHETAQLGSATIDDEDDWDEWSTSTNHSGRPEADDLDDLADDVSPSDQGWDDPGADGL